MALRARSPRYILIMPSVSFIQSSKRFKTSLQANDFTRKFCSWLKIIAYSEGGREFLAVRRSSFKFKSSFALRDSCDEVFSLPLLSSFLCFFVFGFLNSFGFFVDVS